MSKVHSGYPVHISCVELFAFVQLSTLSVALDNVSQSVRVPQYVVTQDFRSHYYLQTYIIRILDLTPQYIGLIKFNPRKWLTPSREEESG